jgi:hypothetical protein
MVVRGEYRLEELAFAVKFKWPEESVVRLFEDLSGRRTEITDEALASVCSLFSILASIGALGRADGALGDPLARADCCGSLFEPRPSPRGRLLECRCGHATRMSWQDVTPDAADAAAPRNDGTGVAGGTEP